MKSLHGKATISQSCSCASCLYKSEIDRPSVGKIIAQGSRVDKLYLGKFVPLRERKLLGKLVRTRAVYDDIRTQLLTESNLSISEKADLKPRQNSLLDDDEAQRSSAILELVNLVDKGAVLGQRKLSECCSCCSCGSTIPLHEHDPRVHRHGRAHISSRSSMISGHWVKDGQRTGKHVRRNIKHILSDPNPITSRISGLMKKESKVLLKKLHGRKQQQQAFDYSYEATYVNETEDQKKKFKGYKVKQAMGETMRKSLTQLRQSKANAQKSGEIIRDKVKGKINAGLKKPSHKLKQQEQSLLSDDDENKFDIKKDSITKYREGIQRKLKDWECDSDCNPNKCLKKCYKTKTKKRLHKRSRNVDKSEMYHKTAETSSISEIGIQAKNYETVAKTATTNHKITANNLNKKVSFTEPHMNKDDAKNNTKRDKTSFKHSKKKNAKVDAGLSKGPKILIITKSVKSNTSLPPTNSKASVQSSKKKEQSKLITSENNERTKSKNKEEKNTEKPLAVSIGSSFPQSGGLALRRCFCTLKIKPNKNKTKANKNHLERVVSKRLQTIKLSQMPVLLPYECEPKVCVPGKCDPIECQKRILKRRKRHSIMTNTKRSNYEQKSIPSTTSKSVSSGESKRPKAKGDHAKSSRQRHYKSIIIDKPPRPRQAVRISSSFRFDIEFSRDGNYMDDHSKKTDNLPAFNENKKIMIKDKAAKKRVAYQVAHKSSQMTSSGKTKNTYTNHSLRRCFCTLKIAKQDQKENKLQSYSRGTLTPRQSLLTKALPKVMDKSTEKRERKFNDKNVLLPYQCKPGICVPGQCNPYDCLLINQKLKDRTHSKLSGTDKRKTKSTYSITRKRIMHGKAVHVKSVSSVNHVKLAQKNMPRAIKSSSDKQTVRIGSTFNFNVEFYKQKIPSTREIPINNFQQAPSKYVTQENGLRERQSKGIIQKMNTIKSASQTEIVKNKNKASGIRPLLKRCFCTLKLQNTKHIVMPVLVPNRTFSTNRREDLRRLQNLLSDQSDKHGFNSSCFSSLLSTSCNDSSQNYYKSYRQISNVSTINNLNSVTSSRLIIAKVSHQRNNSVNQYLKNTFYAMNMQVQNTQKKKAYKLEPYECEPGICIPGKCNPLECQKLIMKRLMKRASTMTSTENQSRSVSSGMLNLKSKQQQYNKEPVIQKVQKVEKEQGIKYKTLPRSNKQVVRVGSSFSFNIEFSKDRTTAQPVIQKIQRSKEHGSSSTNTKLKPTRSISTRGSQVRRQHRPSQSLVTVYHKGSNASPKMKRCFCTLKLQKKGRQNQAGDEKVIQQNTIKTIDAGQNTKKIKQYFLSDLDPNECEPNFCIPGECDPHKCLERIKLRENTRNTKDFGTGMRKRRTSASSMTSSQKRYKKAKQANFKEKAVKKVRVPIEKNVIQATKPSRQVVRIGSSFSFDIEFIKDTSNANEVISSRNLPSRMHQKQKQSQIVTKDKHLKNKNLQDSKLIHHQESQVDASGHHAKSTITDSFMKRCFCTAKLHKQKEIRQIENKHITRTSESSPSQSFFKKCICLLKSFAAVKTKPKMPNADAFAQTKKYKEMRQERNINSIKLLPYECEPGVCVPGQCDPRICEERIRKRKANLDKMSSTMGSGSRSTSTLYRSPKTSTSSTAHMQNKITKKKQPQVRRQSQSYSKSPERTIPNRRSAVRIGSNFSFNVEFYKEKSLASENYQRAAQAIKEPRHHSVASTETRTKKPHAKAKAIDKTVLIHNRESQVDTIKKEDKGTGVSHMLKRCFCTLALQKPTVQKPTAIEKNVMENGDKMQMVTKGTETPIKMYKKKFNSKQKASPKPYNLEPYECEPGICIPGQCNPYECEKRIKRRPRKDSSTVTKTLISKSASTMKKDAKRKYKNQDMQAYNKRKISTASKHQVPVRDSLATSKGHNDGARQAVRIGSNFSFNIEFSKDKTDICNDNIVPKIKNGTKSTYSQPIARDFTHSRHKKTQGNQRMRHVDSQGLAKKVKSTVTETAPFLKRCFCTLALKNNVKGNEHKMPQVKKDRPINAVQVRHLQCKPNICRSKKCESDCPKKTQTRKQPDEFKRTFNILDPHECEPGICIPGECDPHECLKRIQNRMHSKTSNTEASTKRKISTATSRPESFSANTNTRIKEKQTREAGHNLQTKNKVPLQSPTNGNKQVVRISSNFSFNIEFFKDTRKGNGHKMNLPSKHSTNRMSQMTEQEARKVTHAGSGNQTKNYNRQLQSDVYGTESKASQARPIRKRCFCTLKLQKVGRLYQKDTTQPEPAQKMKDVSVSAKLKDRRNILKMQQRRSLEPYECEPNTCIPGECNPLECYERIKRRDVNNFGTDTNRPCMKSVISSTGNQKAQLKKIQTQKMTTVVTKSANNQAKRKLKHSSLAENRNRQSVRLGSNFSFGIEFNKEFSTNAIPNSKIDTIRSMVDTQKQIKMKPAKTTNQGSYGQSPSAHHRTQQAQIAQATKGTGIVPLIKRCFCTLTLHNTVTNKFNNSQCMIPNVSTIDKYISTKNKKGLNVSYESDLAKYPKTVKIINLQSKTKEKSQRRRSQTKTPGIDEHCLTYRMDSNNHNIQFCKENKKPIGTNHADLKKICEFKTNKSALTWMQLTCMNDMAKTIETEDKASIALKKCLYTPEFNQKKAHKNEITVGRVEEIITKSPFKPTQYYAYQMNREPCKCININKKNNDLEYTETIRKENQSKVKSSNKHKKELKTNDLNHNLNTSENKGPEKNVNKTKKQRSNDVKNNKHHETEHILKKINDVNNNEKNKAKDMETILPYKPKRFVKIKSETLLSPEKVGGRPHCYLNCIKKGALRPKHAKRLTGTNENNVLLQEANPAGPYKFICSCIKRFSKRQNKNTEASSKHDSLTTGDEEKQNLSQSQGTGLKMFVCSCMKRLTKLGVKKSELERVGNNESDHVPERGLSHPASNHAKTIEKGHCPCKHSSLEHRRNIKAAGPMKKKVCICLKHSKQSKTKGHCPCKHKEEVTNQKHSKAKGHCPCKHKEEVTNKTSVDSPCDGIKKSKSEKGPRDKRLSVTKTEKMLKKSKSLKAAGITLRKVGHQHKNNYSILQSGDATQNRSRENDKLAHEANVKFPDKIKSKHAQFIKSGQNRKPCVCARKNTKLDHNTKHTQFIKSGQNRKPCVCTRKNTKLDHNTKHTQFIKSGQNRKPCVCTRKNTKLDHNTSERVHPKISGKPENFGNKKSCKCNRKNTFKNQMSKNKNQNLQKNGKKVNSHNICACPKKRKSKKKKKPRVKLGEQITIKWADYLRRRTWKKEDKARRMQRAKIDKKMMEDVIKYKDSGDCILVAGSVVDIAKLGCTTIVDVLRSTYRTVADPKRTIRGMKTALTNPKRALADAKLACSDSGVGSTVNRVRTRLGLLSCVQAGKERMEECGPLNYLLHINDKDPQKKHTPRKKKKKREPMDFNCSLYMGSLRKRPWLAVWYTCPWFYPHCMSLLAIWKQVSDLFLFLLAVLVWSPCIFLMETCRALMCCMLCTG